MPANHKPQKFVIARVGRNVVVRGPFPGGMLRSLTANTVDEARARSVIQERDKTTREDQFALVPASEIEELRTPKSLRDLTRSL